MSESENLRNSAEEDTENIINILVATDIHLGYNEKDTIRGEDSFIAFEEILQIAQERGVDFILLGGDLFHDANPSPNSLQKCLKMLRSYTLGDKPISIEFLSDQSINFHDSASRTVNYEDPHINIELPIFSIHGNHDDPSGFGRLSSLDILSTTGLVNYFGKCVDLTKIEIKPLLIRKGQTQLALYGLSHIHDCRLARLFNDSKVVMHKPPPDSGEWFNVLVLHQNRADRGPKNYLPEIVLPDFLHFVIWGHEHDCRIWPEENPTKGFLVSQPGSSVATSLAEGESIDKHIGRLEICGTKYRFEPIKLKTVRPFIFDSVNLVDHFDELRLDEGDVQAKVQQFASDRIEGMVERAKDKLSGNPKQPKKPLIRLRISYTEEDQMFNAIRFGQQYNTKVANPMDVILFKRLIKRSKNDTRLLDESAMDQAFINERVKDEVRVEDIVDRYFNHEIDETKQLQILSSRGLSELCRRLVEHDDDDAAKNILEFHKQKACEYLNDKLPSQDDVDDELLSFKMKEDDVYQSMLKMLDERGTRRVTNRDNDENDSNSEVEFGSNNKTTTKHALTGRGRGRGRGTRGAASTNRGSLTSRQQPAKSKQAELDVVTSKKSKATLKKQPVIDNFATSSQRSKRTLKPSLRYTQYNSDDSE